MNLAGKNVFIVDIECDGLLPVLTKLHVLSAAYQNDDGSWSMLDTNDPERIQDLVGNPDNVIIGHNFINYDKRALEKLGFKVNATIICTLGLSWYLYADRFNHGLGSWGEDFGVPKPEIEDEAWKGIDQDKLDLIEKYEAGHRDEGFEELYPSYKKEKEAHYTLMAHRCNEDVKINLNLWILLYNLLLELYEGDIDAVVKTINLCNFQLEALVMQDENPILLDKELTEKNLGILEGVIEEKSDKLKTVMPEVPKTAVRKKPNSLYKKGGSKPKVVFKQNGDLSSAGEKWFNLLEENGLPQDHEEDVMILSATGEKWLNLLSRANLAEDYDGEIKEVTKMEAPNPSSPPQVKAWLTSLGWEPKLFNDGANGPVPQLRDQEKNLCQSVLDLIETIPEVEYLQGLSVASHRAGVLKNFLKHCDENNNIRAAASKFTRTMRLAHKSPVVNIPSNTSTHGELIRICMISPEGYEWVNADLDSLEDRCKMIQVAPWASEKYLNKPDDYDPHLEVAIAAGLMTEEESDFLKWYRAGKDANTCPEAYNLMSEDEWGIEGIRLGDVRDIGKTSNYAIIYGIGAFKLGKTLGIPQKEAKKIIDAYWQIHKPVKDYSATLKTKEVDGRSWVYSPFTNLWLHYKGDHNLFSACTQNFGAVVHSRLMYFYIQAGIKPISNIHDEVSWYNPIGKREECEQTVEHCVEKLNQSFGFDIKFGAAPEFANSYGEVH